MDAGNTIPWRATLRPHRSLTRQGYLTVMIIVAAANFATGILFVSIGAWPMTGFAGLDVLLLWWAFRANFAHARKEERISITDHEVVLECFRDETLVEERRFVRRWARVELDEDRDRELIGRLSIVSGRTRVPIGEFLAPDERKTLARALRSALAIPRI